MLSTQWVLPKNFEEVPRQKDKHRLRLSLLFKPSCRKERLVFYSTVAPPLSRDVLS